MDITDKQIANLTPEQVELLDNNPDKLADVLAEQEAGTSAKPKQEVQQGAANGAGEDGEDEPVVLNKSGKGVIPYSTVKDLRVDNAELRGQMALMQEKLDANAKLAELAQEKVNARTPEERKEAQANFDAFMATTNEDMPEIAGIAKYLYDDNREIRAEMNEIAATVRKNEQYIVQRAEMTDKQMIDEAIDNNPDLAHWIRNDPIAWEQAEQQDEALKREKAWASKSYDERFAEAARRVRAINPDASPVPKLTEAQQKKATAKAVVDKVAPRKPTTLSDIAGGGSPTASESEELANMSGPELSARIVKMSPNRARALRADLE